MEHSAVGRLTVPTALVVLELVARLALPASLLALARGLAVAAVTVSLVSTLATAARSILLGWWTERAVVGAWRRTIDAARGQLPVTLKTLEEGRVTALVTAVREAALHEAQEMPHVLALVIGIAVVGAATLLLLSPAWVAFGALSAGALGLLAGASRGRLGRAHERAWNEFSGAARDMGVLVAASAELRAHARERAFASALLASVERMGRAEMVAMVWQAAVGLLPAGLAVAAVAGPVRAGAGWAVRALSTGTGFADVGVLGGTALLLGLALASAAERISRSAPQRRALAAFVAESAPGPRPPRGGTARLTRSLAEAQIAFEDVSCVHPGALSATPGGVSYLWDWPDGGLVVTGANGAGKSTLVLALLGLIAPAAGRITVDGVSLADLDLDDLRRRVAFLPQGPFVAPGESVAWHLRLFLDGAISDERLDAALVEVGLMPVLEGRAARRGRAPRDLPMAELSGGERQRVHLCRVALHDAELVILDEPEVALDRGGRDLVRVLLDKWSHDRRVLLIAHDETVIPATFSRLSCVPGTVGPNTRPRQNSW